MRRSKPADRYKATVEGRVFYVYAQSEQAARATFQACYQGHWEAVNGYKLFALDRDLHVERDTGEWKTALQDGRTVFG